MRGRANAADTGGDQGSIPGRAPFQQLLKSAEERPHGICFHYLLDSVDRVDFDFDFEVALDAGNGINRGGYDWHNFRL